MESTATIISNPQLAQVIEQLSLAELNHFTNEVVALRARRNAPVLSADESALFAIINQTLSESERERLAALGERRANETLTSDEHEELLALQHKLEGLHAARMKALASLAELRGVTLTAVMDQLGIHFPDYA
jgi:hypothetical protein